MTYTALGNLWHAPIPYITTGSAVACETGPFFPRDHDQQSAALYFPQAAVLCSQLVNGETVCQVSHSRLLPANSYPMQTCRVITKCILRSEIVHTGEHRPSVLTVMILMTLHGIK